jgi:hypothetical protein
MLVFLRPALRWVPLRFLPRELFLVELFFVSANPADVVAIAPISKVNARKEERIVFMHYQCAPAAKVRSKITMELSI